MDEQEEDNMSRDIIDLLPTEFQKKTWERLIACMRYSKGQYMILACQILKDRLDFRQINVNRFMETFNSSDPKVTFEMTYENNVIRALVRRSGLTDKEFLVRKEALSSRQQEKLITDWYAKFCEQDYYEAKKPALLAMLQECMNNKKFFHIAAIALLLRQKKQIDMTYEERTIFEVLYSPEGTAFFSPYLRQNEYDTCKNAFGERAPLYTYSARPPLDILAGQFYVKTKIVFFTVLLKLQQIYSDAVFYDECSIKERHVKAHWDFITESMSLLPKEMLKSLGPIPADLLSEKLQADLGYTASDLMLPKNFSSEFRVDLCIYFIKEIKPFIDTYRNVILRDLSKALVFNDLEAISILIETLQLELLVIRKQKVNDNHDIFLAAKKAYELVSLEFKLAKKAATLYPGVGRLLLGYVTRNFAYILNYLAKQELNKGAFFKTFPEFESVFFWQCVFSMEPLAKAQLHYGLLQMACSHVDLSNQDVVAKPNNYKTELTRSGLQSLRFFSIRNGGCDEAEQLNAHYRFGFDEARLRKLMQELRSQQQCGGVLSFGGGRLPSC